MQNVTLLSVQTRGLAVDGLEGDDLQEAVHDFVSAEVRRLSDHADALMSCAYDLEQINFEDQRLLKRLANETESVTIDRLQSLWQEVSLPDRERDARERALREKSYTKSKALRYFTITNARGNIIHILADDAAVARYIAASIGRITSRQNGNLRAYDNLSVEKLPYGVGIEEAIAYGYPGVIEIMGTKVIHCSKKTVFG